MDGNRIKRSTIHQFTAQMTDYRQPDYKHATTRQLTSIHPRYINNFVKLCNLM